MRTTPEGFRRVTGPGGRLWLLRDGVSFDLKPDRWDGWMAGREGTILISEGGRSPARRLNVPGIGDLVMRRYHHGGALRGITRDYFPGMGRALLELRASDRLRQCGVATPEILAVFSRRYAFGLRRGFLLSRFVPDGENLRQWVRRSGTKAGSWKPILSEVARTVASLHAAGCKHGDLNLSNLLLARRKIWILDLDGARLRIELGVAERGRNLLRLYRSLCKESRRGEPLSSKERLLFLRHYARGNPRLLRALVVWGNARWWGAAVRRGFVGRRIMGPE
jgi:tRNA A-37 threonylcarbamoyl transferase component Bud32